MKFAHNFPQPGGNLRIRGKLEISQVQTRAKCPREILKCLTILKFTKGEGIYRESPKKAEYMITFFLPLHETVTNLKDRCKTMILTHKHIPA